jgi:hypothetical protein
MCKAEVRIERTTERGARVRPHDWAHTCVAAHGLGPMVKACIPGPPVRWTGQSGPGLEPETRARGPSASVRRQGLGDEVRHVLGELVQDGGVGIQLMAGGIRGERDMLTALRLEL